MTYEQIRSDFCAAADVRSGDFDTWCEGAAAGALVGRHLMAERMREWFIAELQGGGDSVFGGCDRLRPAAVIAAMDAYEPVRVWVALLGLRCRGVS